MANPLCLFIIHYYYIILLQLFYGVAFSDNGFCNLTAPTIIGEREDFYGSHERPHLSYAVMPLHGDIANDGYYATQLHVGTPPQKFSLIVDTGSYLTFIPCSDSEECGKHQDKSYEPKISRTYRPVECNPSCECDSPRLQCSYDVDYREGSSSSGVLAEDMFYFGSRRQLPPQLTVFGCELEAHGDIYSLKADGIMGLSPHRLSIVDQLVARGVIDDSFSLCYGGMDVSGGAMILGAIPPPPSMAFTYWDRHRRNSPYYNVELKEIHVAGKALELNPAVFDKGHGTVVDSGTTYAFLPEEAFIAFRDAILSQTSFLEKIDGPNPDIEDICFHTEARNCSDLSQIFPDVKMVFKNNQKVSLSQENYLFRYPNKSGAYCLGIYQSEDPTTLLGGIIARNTLVTYDRQNSRIGFLKTNCTKLWNELGEEELPTDDEGEEIPGEYQSNCSDQRDLSISARIVDQVMHDEF